MMTTESVTWIISRHPGAVEWIRKRGFKGEVINHFDGSTIPGDTYIGTLPLNMIARILQDDGNFILLVMPDLPRDQRGEELTPNMMDKFGAGLIRIKSIEMEEITEEITEIDEKSAAESIEIVEDAITLKALSEYLTADIGEYIGVYADGSYAVGPDIGNEIDPAERPIACVRCPGYNLDTSRYTNDFVTYDHDLNAYRSLERDEYGFTTLYTLKGVIEECCRTRDVEDKLQELRAILTAEAEQSA